MFIALTCAEQFSDESADHCRWPSLHPDPGDAEVPLEAYAILLGWADWHGRHPDHETYRQGTRP